MRAATLSLALDAGGRPVIVVGDRARLIQVFANLLTNAAKYTAAGGRIAVRWKWLAAARASR
jgi:signal transduction histidine kinase